MANNTSILKILDLEDTCTACSACYNICPKQAITIEENEEGFYYPKVNSDLCIGCKLCDKTCPVINAQNQERDFTAYYGYSTNENVVKSSSSGGAFYSIAQNILDNGGVVFGAAFNYGDNLRLEHRSTREFPIEALMKSKYVQSYIGTSFHRAKELLDDGVNVMFVGTPCQINGLHTYLKKDYDNLLTVDFICHGVPSMDMLKKHLEYIGFNDTKSITQIDFRPKVFTWVDYFVIKSKSRKYKRYYRYDEYFDFFQKNQNIRRSCSACISCNGRNRSADITLADFWGYQKAGVPIPKGVRGLSLILANTQKGERHISGLNHENFIINPLDPQHAKYVFARDRRNIQSGYDSAKRNQLVHSVYKIGYAQTMRKYGTMPRWHKVLLFDLKTKIKKILGRI